MVKVDLWGRMGNQMFQYAFALDTARKFKSFFLIAPTEKFELTKYFRLDFFTRLCYSTIFFKLYNKIVYRLCNTELISQINEGSVSLKNNVSYRGFFQSENFFLESKAEVKSKLVLRRKWRLQFLNEYGNLFTQDKKNIVMHFRRTDYQFFGDDSYGGLDMCLPMSYYDNCLNLIENLNDYRIICISDDLEFVKDYYKEKTNYLFFSNDAIIDFQFILNANIAIIANSSFSWWAAYLNDRTDKIVYAPEFWLGFKVNQEIPSKIIPKDFKSVNVN